jgi:hypothetical protein
LDIDALSWLETSKAGRAPALARAHTTTTTRAHMNLARTMTALASLALMAPLAAAAPQTRAASDAEVKAFASYYQQQFPGLAPGKPVFTASRAEPKSAWTLAATVDTPPQRGVHVLCRMDRREFSYAGRWSASGAPRQFAWIDRAGCGAPARPVEMRQQLPDVELGALLEHQGALLQSARLLFSGNTGCARQRSYRFALTAVEIGSAGPSPELLVGLVFTSDHDTVAKVWARRNGLDYAVWNVSCP